jgi:hypothetical protein
MTAAELLQKFNLHYDNILSAAAPGLNEYEISLYLTQAHREVVSSYYNGVMGGDTVDSTEAVKSLIPRYILSDSIQITQLAPNQIEGLFSYIVDLNSQVLQLLAERIKGPNNSEEVVRNILVKPINIDVLYRLMRNPFRRPSDLRVWRLDQTSNEDTTERQIILISNEDLASEDFQYIYTYMKEPEAILLVDLDSEEWASIGDLSIMGQKRANVDGDLGDKISPTLWELIINRAVELATRDYKENTLNTQIALNRRVE